MAGGVLRSKGWDQRNFASQRLLLMRQTVQKKDQHGLGSLLGVRLYFTRNDRLGRDETLSQILHLLPDRAMRECSLRGLHLA